MAEIVVNYEYRSTYRAVIEISDAAIAEVLEEWKEDNEEGWEPTEDDVREAIGALLENDFFDHLDPMSDEEFGWGETEIEDWSVLVPYHIPTYSELNPEIAGQTALITVEALDQIHMGNEVL